MKTLITATCLPRLFTTAIFSALALGSAAASVAAGDSAPQVVVKFGDLNLSNAQGAAELYNRIAAAGKEVCRSLDSRDLATRARLDACVHKAIADAVTMVDRPELFAIYNAKTHQPRPIVLAAAKTY
jgi:UrcA family protein